MPVVVTQVSTTATISNATKRKRVMEPFQLAIKCCSPVVTLMTSVYNSLILVTLTYLTTRAPGCTCYLETRTSKNQKYYLNTAHDYLSRSLNCLITLD